MSYTFVAKDDLRAHLLAAVVFCCRSAQHQGGDPQFVAGVLALAECRAIGEGFDWPAILTDARGALGRDVGKLIDTALLLEVDHA